MSSGYAKWSDVRAKGREADPRTTEEQAAGKVAARERRDAYVRGRQLAEMRAAAGMTQAELADALGAPQVRISKIEHGEISGIEDRRPAARTAARLASVASPAGPAPPIS